ncbi:hypothetical protein Tco_0137963 [Tanacetum coccineum]
MNNLAPNGGGLILYQAYGNLYAMTGRKAHLLEDKQILSLGVFDEVFLALGWHLEEIHMTWAHLEKKRTRLRTCTKIHQEVLFSERETAVPEVIKRPRSDYLVMCSGLLRRSSQVVIQRTYSAYGVVKLRVEVFTTTASIAKELGMIQYLEKVKALAGSFKKFSIKQVPISENKKVDALSKIAPTSFAHLTKQVLVEELKDKSINEAEVLAVVEEEGDTWMTPIYKYLTEETLPTEKEKARAIRCKSGRYDYACQNEICGSKGHTDMILLANNACGCKKDDKGMSRLQVHRPVPRNPQQKLTPIISPWPFYKWGIDVRIRIFR